MAFNYEEKVMELQNDPVFAAKVAEAKTADDFVAIYKEFDIELTTEEAEEILAALEVETVDADDEELTVEQMDQVNGGLVIAGVVIPALIWKTALALVATCGAVAAVKKLKKKYAKYF